MAQHDSPHGVRPARRLFTDVWRGVKIAGLGLRTWGTSRRLMTWGLLPGAITLVIFSVLALLLVTQVWGWAGAISRALVASDGLLQGVIHLVAAIAIVVGAVVVGIYTFTAVTLTVGQVFFERISRTVDEAAGFAGTDTDEPWYRSLARGLGEIARVAVLTVPLAIVLFVVGLIPVVGGVTSFVLGVAFGGWFLALELTAYPLERRRLVTLAERRAALRGARATVVGFGAAIFVLFLIPLGPALFMPAAVAGATRLVQEVPGTPAQSD